MIFVMGGHRSGTSMVAGVLARLGIHMGDNLNEHYEDWQMLDINNRVLDACGGAWSNVPPAATIAGLANPELAAYASHYLRGRENRLGINGVKDPRLCITLPWLLKVAPAGRDRDRFIWIRRDIESVARSLEEYGQWGAAIRRAGVAKDLALAYVRRAEEALLGCRAHALIMQYDCALANPLVSVLRIAHFLGLPRDERRWLGASHFINPLLNHHGGQT